MRELSLEESVAAMEKMKASAEQEPTHRKSVTTHMSGEGRKLLLLLQRAAGLQDHRVKTLEVCISAKEAIVFTAELYGTTEDISEALKLAKE